MDVYKVKIYPTAKQDLQEIIDYLNTLSQQAAFGTTICSLRESRASRKCRFDAQSRVILRWQPRAIGI